MGDGIESELESLEASVAKCRVSRESLTQEYHSAKVLCKRLEADAAQNPGAYTPLEMSKLSALCLEVRRLGFENGTRLLQDTKQARIEQADELRKRGYSIDF